MTALMMLVTYAWPVLTSAGGCSLSLGSGEIQETDGRVPALACLKKLFSG
jgi:hypothetical protein